MQRNLILALLGVAVLVLAPGPAFRAETPSKIERVPVFQGAVLVPKGEANAGEVRRDYSVGKPIEEVVAFYRQRLGGVPVPNADELTNRGDDARERLRSGSVSPVWMLAEVHDFDDPESWPPRFLETATPKALRRGFVEKRTPYRPGEWLSSAEIDWLRGTSDGQLHFRVVIMDETPQEIMQA